MVLQEKSGEDERDELLAQASTWQSVAERVYGVDMTITTGSETQNTFTTGFLTNAHPFVYKSVLALPDHGKKETLRSQRQGRESPAHRFAEGSSTR